ncbi:calcium/sodium antiporter [Subsaxibacter sp. CAU 1640]|uniref:calcium/sodium antiporter n=1 Tax=Subsaxibacter sp. CAU 1640 TaxID=2933271 RepID=UPI0020049054|nr:calcium/sodium antiporter [Subsaxibacter sp. CAU 1640]MCK7591389.1 calcium/sodium antiporter [Subsaxibacter sp. CAU 1640]
MSLLWVILGLILLVVGGEFLVRSSVALSFKFNISKLVIGMTVVSFATSAPELLVSLQAALDGSSDIALGNVIGSNIANIGLVLGVTALISPLGIDKNFYKLNWPMMMLLSVVMYFILESGDVLDFKEGLALFLALIVFLYVLIKRSKSEPETHIEDLDDDLKITSNFKIIIWLLIGASALYFGSEWLVRGAKEMAISLGVSERVISITMVAVGTSVPELAASVIAALKKEKAISLGNLIGSNVFNIASVLGLTAMIQPIYVNNPNILTNDIFWMMGFAAILLPFVFLPKKFEIGRIKGFILIAAYVAFVVLAFTGEN